MEDPSDINVAQIENLRKRLNLTRMMQVFGIASLFFCVVTMFLISFYIFELALLLLIASLGVSLREIQISTRALDIYLSTMEGKLKH